MAVTFLQPDAVTAAKIIADSNDRLIKELKEFRMALSQEMQDFNATVEAAFTELSTATDALATSNTGLAADVAGLKDEIVKLQSSPQMSEEDKASLVSIAGRFGTIADKVKVQSDAIAALDALTTPPTPSA